MLYQCEIRVLYTLSNNNNNNVKYCTLIADANITTNKNVMEIINDFYNYFYINKNIYNINYSLSLEKLDNNYKNKIYNLNLLENIKIINIKEQQIFIEITIYTFNICISNKDIFNLFKYPDIEDTNLIKYYK
jgi:hypothetical protein